MSFFLFFFNHRSFRPFVSVIIEPLLKNQIAVDYLWEVLNPVLVEALSTVRETTSRIPFVKPQRLDRKLIIC